MEVSISSIFQLLFIVSAFLFVIGIIRPGFVVFWSERKSRVSVVAVWGAAMLVLGIAYFISLDRKSGDSHGSNTTEIKTVRRG